MPLLVVGGQVAVTGLSAALASIWGVDAVKAVFFGGAVAFLPNAVFALGAAAMARAGGKLPATVEAAGLLGGWVAKLALTVALLLAAIAVAKVGSGAFFVGLAVSLATPLAAPAMAAALKACAARSALRADGAVGGTASGAKGDPA